jgi:hypothetical protein
LPSASPLDTRQRSLLCRVPTRALGTETGGGAHWTRLCRGPLEQTLGKISFFAECQRRHSAKDLSPSLGAVTVTFLCRVSNGTRQNSLPSARQKVLSKEAVADVQFAERSLPSVTLGKAFAECKIAFAECLRHSTKELCPIVSALRRPQPRARSPSCTVSMVTLTLTLSRLSLLRPLRAAAPRSASWSLSGFLSVRGGDFLSVLGCLRCSFGALGPVRLQCSRSLARLPPVLSVPGAYSPPELPVSSPAPFFSSELRCSLLETSGALWSLLPARLTVHSVLGAVRCSLPGSLLPPPGMAHSGAPSSRRGASSAPSSGTYLYISVLCMCKCEYVYT